MGVKLHQVGDSANLRGGGVNLSTPNLKCHCTIYFHKLPFFRSLTLFSSLGYPLRSSYLCILCFKACAIMPAGCPQVFLGSRTGRAKSTEDTQVIVSVFWCYGRTVLVYGYRLQQLNA
jgi:hypothetical protein